MFQRLITYHRSLIHMLIRTLVAQLRAIIHFWNYAKKPTYNGKIERYNRTIQDEFIDPYIASLFGGIDEFNQRLADWCIFYNAKRPHYSHREPNNRTIQIPPLRAYVYMLKLDQEKSNMLWTHTNSCIIITNIIQ